MSAGQKSNPPLDFNDKVLDMIDSLEFNAAMCVAGLTGAAVSSDLSLQFISAVTAITGAITTAKALKYYIDDKHVSSQDDNSPQI